MKAIMCRLAACAMAGVILPASGETNHGYVQSEDQSLRRASAEIPARSDPPYKHSRAAGAAEIVAVPLDEKYRDEEPSEVRGPGSERDSARLVISTDDRKKSAERSNTFVAATLLAQTDSNVSSPKPRIDESREGRRESVETIVVTARRRAESIQDVPLSIAVISADAIDSRGLANAEDFLRGVPGASHVDSPPYGQAIVIRGLETAPSSQNYVSGPTVATYFGEIPTTNTAGLSGGSNVDLKLVDIERVEVLRGPQGTSFGNASMGGAVRTIPVVPKLDQVEASVAAAYSVTSGSGDENNNFQAIGNIPVWSNRIAVRGVLYRYNDSGYYKNRAGSDEMYQQTVVRPYGAESFAVDDDEVGSTNVLGGRFSALLQASDDFRFTLSYLSQKAETSGFPGATSGRYEQTILGVAPEHIVRDQENGVFDTDIDIGNAIAEYDFGWASLLATYSYIKSGTTRSIPFSSVNLNWPLSQIAPSDHRERVGEVRFVSQLENSWNFLAGVYVERIDDDTRFNYLWYGDVNTNFFSVGERFVGDYSDQRNSEQTAVFGEVSWELLPRLTVTGGVRAYEYDRTGMIDTIGPLFGVASSSNDADASGATYRGNVSYKPSEQALVYAGWSQGFRLGRPQAGIPPGICDRDSDGVIDGTSTTIESTKLLSSDDVDNYELGSRFTVWNGGLTIDAAIFRLEWSGMPVLVTAGSLSDGCGLTYQANAGTARSEGVELQAGVQLSKPLRLEVGGSYTHATLQEDVPALNASKGNRLPGSPEINANLSLQYDFEVLGYAASLRADSVYVGSSYGDLTEAPRLEAGDYTKLDVSARAEMGALDVDFFVRNLTNQDAFTSRGTDSTVGPVYGFRLRPRTFGVRLGYRF